MTITLFVIVDDRGLLAPAGKGDWLDPANLTAAPAVYGSEERANQLICSTRRRWYRAEHGPETWRAVPLLCTEAERVTCRWCGGAGHLEFVFNGFYHLACAAEALPRVPQGEGAMKKYEYKSVERNTVETLNELGADGWQPAALRWEEGFSRSAALGGGWINEGWTGLLYREKASYDERDIFLEGYAFGMDHDRDQSLDEGADGAWAEHSRLRKARDE